MPMVPRRALKRRLLRSLILAACALVVAGPAQAYWRGNMWIGVGPALPYGPPPPVYMPPPVIYAPPPPVAYPPPYVPVYPRPVQVWIPGHWGPWGWVPGHWEYR